MAPKLKLTYFDIEGAAEPVRLALALADVPFEDVRINFTEWKDVKPTTPYGQVPILTIDGGEAKTQSGAMLRYAGTLDQTNTLYPADKMYDIEEAIGLIEDLKRSWSPNLYLGMKAEQYGHPEGFAKTPVGTAKIESMRKAWIANELPRFLGYISARIDKNGGTYLCGGERPTVADCVAVPILRSFTKGYIDHVDADCVRDCSSKIVDYLERFCGLPEIKGRYDSGIF